MIVPGVLAGLVAGAVMAAVMMLFALSSGHSVWTNPDLIAALWRGPAAANGKFSNGTMLGLATHMATSAVMGIVALPFIARLPAWRTMLAAIAYALASFPLVFATVLAWADPTMFQAVRMLPMTVAHLVFGQPWGRLSSRCGPRRAYSM